MSIQFAFFSVPMGNPLDVGEDLNRLLKSVRVLTVHREFVSDGGNSVWAFAVEYLSGTMDQKKGRPGKGRVDYREVLSPEDFALFVKLRDWRKETAGREAIPVYTVFTNEQLANLAKSRPGTMTGLGKFKAYENRCEKGMWSEAALQRHMEPLVAFVKGSHARAFRTNVMHRYGVLS